MTLTDGHFCNKVERKVLSHPVKYDGMGIAIIAENEYNNSRAVSASLIKLQLEYIKLRISNLDKIHKN